MILDLIFLAILALMGYLAYRRGFLLSLGRLLITVLSWILAASLSLPLALALGRLPQVASLKFHLQSLVTPLLGQQFGAVDLGLSKALDPLLASGHLASYRQSLDSALASGQNLVVEKATAGLVNVLAQLFLQALAFFLIFFVVRFLGSLLLRLLNGVVSHTPVVNQANRLAGMAIGLLTGAIIVLACAVFLAAGFSPFPGIRDQVSQSYILGFIYQQAWFSKLLLHFY